MRRMIHEVVFFGNDSAAAGVSMAHARLTDAFGILSGAQQPGHPTSDEEAAAEAKERADLEAEMRACAADILTALGFLAEAADIESR